jgi:hypothetical protein
VGRRYRDAVDTVDAVDTGDAVVWCLREMKG